MDASSLAQGSTVRVQPKVFTYVRKSLKEKFGKSLQEKFGNSLQEKFGKSLPQCSEALYRGQRPQY
jgi:hypothetical protein